MSELVKVSIPDLGGAEDVQVVEILVAPGDRVAIDDGLVTLESDKASMDVPSPASGIVREIHVQTGAKVEEGDLVLTLQSEESVVGDTAVSTVEQGSGESAEIESGSNEPETETAGGAGDAAEEDSDRDAGTASAEPAEGKAGSSQKARRQSTTDRHAEVLVLGAGPGGYTAAFRAADLGKRVTMVERDPVLGGVCLNVGCIPSKALLHVARVIEETASLEGHGVTFGKPEIDLGRLRMHKQSVVDRLTKGLTALAKQRQVDVVHGQGSFDSPHSLTVETAEGTREITFDQAIIAAGSRVIRIPGIPWEDPRVMDSTAALDLAEIPESLLLIGGGIVGLEMAMIYGSLGSRLTVVEMMDGLIPGCDRDLIKPLERRLRRRFRAQIHLATRVAEIEAVASGLEARFAGDRAPEPEVFDRVLVAVGRQSNGDRIGAEAAGIELDDRGFIPVDRQQRTNVPHLFAIGDITGPPLLAHKATHQGKVAAEVAAGEESGFDARVIPSVAYTDPEIAWVGLTELDAAENGVDYEKGVFPWSASGRSLGMGRSDGMTKILFHPESRKVLGAGIVGPGAGDLIAELALAIEMDCEAADLALTIHPHPTLSETLALAAEAYEGTITDLYVTKKRSG